MSEIKKAATNLCEVLNQAAAKQEAPLPLGEYVVVHELAHLTHPDHGRDFWAAVGRVLPDYEQRRERLRVLGPSLVW